VICGREGVSGEGFQPPFRFQYLETGGWLLIIPSVALAKMAKRTKEGFSSNRICSIKNLLQWGIYLAYN